MGNANAVGKPGFGHKREAQPARPDRTHRWALDGIVCNMVAAAAFLFVVALVFGLI
ncbi:hypothetical protein [Mycoplana ramosa]|uniref:Uncharacterized protein n=1 Tax=Mycoplana ramosa TaxID=40837 RepID=A0ABW3Z1K2_MYCRA